MEYTIFILALPVLSFLILALAGMKLPHKVAGAIGTLSLAAVTVLSYITAVSYFTAQRTAEGLLPVYTPWNFRWLPFTESLHIDMGIMLDPISVMMLVVISTVSLMVHIYSFGYMKGERGFQRYYAFLSLFTFSMLGLVVATNIFQMYVFWELVGVSSYLLIGFYYTKPEAIAASKKAFIVTRFADLGFLIGILIYGYYMQTFTFSPSEEQLMKAGMVLPLALGLMFVGGAGKSAMFPLHIWLPDAMEGPTPVSALIHAATMVVAGVYLVARMFPLFIGFAPETLHWVAYIGMFTAFYAATVACVQSDIKRVLAFSTISQIGFMMVALGVSVYENLALPEPKNQFTIGIEDDITFTSLPKKEEIELEGAGMFEAKFYGLGADGTVGANKNSVKIIGENTNKHCQAYFAYDSKKSGGFTCSHLRFGDSPIRSTYLVNTPNFVACHVQAYLRMYDVTKGLRKNGTFLLNTVWNGDELAKHLPNKVKRYFAQNNITVYYIDATEIAQEIGLGNRTNTILQSAFFRITEVIPVDLAIEQMKKFILKSYGKKGEDVVNKNYAAVDRGGEYKQLVVDAAWANLPDDADEVKDVPAFISDVVYPINAQDGDSLKVSAFKGIEDGTWNAGTSKYEKRGVAAFVPTWTAENCIQCNKCAYVCPHACIRPFVLDDNEVKGFNADTLEIKAPAAMKGMRFRMQVGVMDCLGCGNCVDVCPGSPKTGKALKMVALEEELDEAANWNYLVNNVKSKQNLVDVKSNVKNSQFATPLFEFSGACSGCGETPYVKLITQLFGDREMVSNATGCSSIYSGSVPSTPYTTDENGRGPAWANSLFEDFCEFGMGMTLANDKMRMRLVQLMTDAQSCTCCSDELKALFNEWIANKDDADKSRELAEKIKPMVRACSCDYCRQIAELDHYLVKRSQWIIGGDGASYDIGYGGLDHVIASGKDVNILVLDTEVYSNTGGQASKATPVGAIAKFAAAGKRVRKKDLGMIATTYGYVYVAQVAMGADQAQCLKAIREAEAYNGPSIIIAYAPCINHGLKVGMGKSQAEEAAAVACGYWHLWRYNPALEAEGKNPFSLDSKEPDWSEFQNFLKGEVRFASVMKQYPAEAAELFAAAEDNAKWRYRSYKRMANQSWED